jgi:hypothetical protein
VTSSTFREVAAERGVAQVPLAHLSIELGHLYMEDFEAGRQRLLRQFAKVAPWARTARENCLPTSRRARVSTCFLIDDYFTRFSSPAEVLPMVLETARENGLEIDYVAREAACADADGVRLAELVAGRLLPVPPQGTTGARPPVSDSGWLCNGERTLSQSEGEAMRRAAWTPPTEIGARNHSVFVDVQLWDQDADERRWSCAFLASVWQLLRLGLLRSGGAGVFQPVELGRGFPDTWDALPPLVRVNPMAAPFSAYRTFSVLPSRFLHVEHAVRVILAQVTQEPAVLEQLVRRGVAEGIVIDPDVTERIAYVFFNDN